MPRKVARIENINKDTDRVEDSKKVENSEGFRTGVNDGDFTQLKYKRNNKIIVLCDSDSDLEDDNVTKLQENYKINTNESQSMQRLYYDSESDSDSHREAAINISNERINSLTLTAEKYATNTIDGKKDDVKDVEDKGVILHEIPNIEVNNEIKVDIHQRPVANEVNIDISKKCDNMEEDSGNLVINNEMYHASLSTKESNEIPNEVENEIKLSEDLFSAELSNKNTDDVIIENAQAVEVENKTASDRENEKTEQVIPDNATLGSFELKLKQLEELTMKKFKGTFFDSII